MVKKLQLLILMCFLAILSWQCSKDQLKPDETKISGFKRAANSKERLASVRSTFNSRNIGASVQFKNKSSKTTWVPDWDHPMVNQVNDSVSYVFYPLLRNINKEGKIVSVQVSGARTYLIVRNEEIFFKGIYSPKEIDSDNSLSNFTGILDLINLETNKGVEIDYVNGKASEEYMKKVRESGKKTNIGGITTFGWEQRCHTKTTCTFNAFCTNQVMVAATEGCGYPSMSLPNDCSAWHFIDSNSWEVCEDVYVPDPPTDPGDGGGGGTGGNPTPDVNAEFPCILGKQLQNNTSFINAMKDLQTKTNQNYEYGYYTQNGSSTYSTIQGADGDPGFDFTALGVETLLHSHNGSAGMLSIFSTEDLRTLYTMAVGSASTNGQTNPDAYISLVTPSHGGTAYTLVISDIYKFANWGNVLNDIVVDNVYNLLIQPGNGNTQNEVGFLKLIKNHGLTLLKADYSNIKEWGTITAVGNNDTTITNCNNL